MFTREKKFYQKKGFYIILLSITVAVSVIVNLGSLVQREEESVSQTEAEKNVEEKWWEDDETADESENEPDESEVYENYHREGNTVIKDNLPYYFAVLDDDGIVKVFYYDETGNISLYKNTDIAYDLLTEQDQLSFSQGIMIKTKESLMELLQDFES